MKKHLTILLPLLVAILLILPACTGKAAKHASISGFAALDLPHDDGTGVLLKWKPLDKSNRIIQYNIYRGHTPDSLFLLSKLEVDPKMGVSAEYMNFTDKDYLPLIEFETAPARLKAEKNVIATYEPEPGAGGKKVSSTLYKSVPSDENILSKLLPHYSVLGEITTSKLYNGSKRIEMKTESDTTVYAGSRLSQFSNIYANPKAEHTYYYCVVPVNETGRYLPPSPVKAVKPFHNRPDSSARVYSVMLRDTNVMNFEWSAPLGAYNIGNYEAWLLHRRYIPEFEKDQLANTASPDSMFSANWQQYATLLHTMTPTYWAQSFCDKVDLSGKLLPPADSLVNYHIVLAYQDYWQSEDGSRMESYLTASLGEPVQVALSSQLPKLPAYKVVDKPNDKGDNLIVSFGRPFAYLTQGNFTNSSKSKLRLNYDFSANGYQTIDRIKFTFYDAQNKVIGEVKESFPDKVIYLKLPPKHDNKQDIRVEIATQLIGEKSLSKELIDQNLVYDPASMGYRGGDSASEGQVLNNLFIDVFNRNKLSPYLTPGMRIGALSRGYDFTVPFPSVLTPLIADYDAKSKRLLTNATITVAADSSGMGFSASMYVKDFLADIAELKKQVKELKTQLNPQEPNPEITAQLDALQQQLDYYTSHPLYKQASKGDLSDRAWRRLLLKEQDINSRSYEYKLLITNGKGLWSSDTGIANGKAKETIWSYPHSEWFDTTKIATLIASIIMAIMVVYALIITRRKELYLRPIAGLSELDNAIGRATEMGRPVMFVPGWGTLGDPCTVSAMMILHQIARKTAEYDIRLISPHTDYFVVPLAQEMVQSAYGEMGRPDAYNQNDIFFVSDVQFAFSAAVNGITIRERIATVFYMGYFNAEALLMTETGNQCGAIQIAGSDAITQIPFFITTCDYTLIGEEFYAAAAYLSRNIELVSMLKAQDYFKILIVISVTIGVVLSTLQINALLNFLPFE